MATLNDYLLASGLLFTIGFAGVLLRRNIIIIFMALEFIVIGPPTAATRGRGGHTCTAARAVRRAWNSLERAPQRRGRAHR